MLAFGGQHSAISLNMYKGEILNLSKYEGIEKIKPIRIKACRLVS
jgi:hypothetical protein